MVKDLPSRSPQPGTPLNLLADRIRSMGLEQATRQKRWDDPPIERYVPISNTFLQVASLDIMHGDAAPWIRPADDKQKCFMHRTAMPSDKVELERQGT